MGELTARPMEPNAADAEALARLLTLMYQEVGRAPLNPQKAFLEICDTLEHGAVIGIFHRDLLIASVALVPMTGGLFYSDAPFLVDKWCFVQREYRPTSLDSQAMSLIFKEVQWLCDATGQAAFLRVYNEQRAKPRTAIDRLAQVYCCYPAGAAILVQPKGDASP